MKKILFFAAVATMFAACTKDATKDVAPAKPTDKFYAVIGDEESRVQLNGEGKTVWTKGDKVSVFNKTTDNCSYAFAGKTGDSDGELSYVEGGTTGEAISRVVAVYPYNSANAISADGSTITTVIPESQKYLKESFGVGSSVMVARSEDENLSFKNVMGWIRVALTGERKVKSITLRGNNNEFVAGNATVGSDLSVTINDGAKAVKLTCGTGITLSKQKPTYFYIAVPPQYYWNGISVVISDSKGNTVELVSYAIEVKRNHIVPMASFECAIKEDAPTKQIVYTTSDNKPIATPKSYYHIVSHIFESGKGVITLSGEPTTIAENAFEGRTTLKSVTLPNTVTRIGKEAFKDCSGLESVNIPDGVTRIENYTFGGCKALASITIPKGVTEIGERAFYNCQALTSIDIPGGVTKIGDCAFCYCEGLTSIEIPRGVKNINRCLFQGCTGLTSVTLPYGIVGINMGAFSDCTGLTSIKIPSSVNTILDGAFSSCTGLTSLEIPYGVEKISNSLCHSCSALTSITIPSSVTTIEEMAFYGCKGLTSVTIPSNVTKIGYFAFYNCSGLTSITIPSKVTSIGESAFWYCTELASIYCKPTTPPELSRSVFNGIPSDAKIYVPSASVSAYKSADRWSNYASKIVGYSF